MEQALLAKLDNIERLLYRLVYPDLHYAKHHAALQYLDRAAGELNCKICGKERLKIHRADLYS